MKESVRVDIIVEGLVQGVFFRANTRKVAESLALTGWVMNLPDGRVQILAEGPSGKIEEFVRWCQKGPPFARVDHADVRWSEPTGEFTTFEIRH
ncbi:MAG: acylphosphatase [candidate division WOR-3 bacterium]|nr:MAG: acylphosphatase [candidate division WOR-3 bacterium]